jgi:hypothetical protein
MRRVSSQHRTRWYGKNDRGGAVPHQSGLAPEKGVKQIFRTNGYDHQGSYNNESMLALTLQLIARIALGAK